VTNPRVSVDQLNRHLGALVSTDGPETGIALILQLGISIGRTDMAI